MAEGSIHRSKCKRCEGWGYGDDYSDNFAVKKYNKNSVQNDLDNNPILTYNFPFETIDDDKGDPHEYLYISDQDIRYAFKGYEKDEALIVPGKKMLIV